MRRPKEVAILLEILSRYDLVLIQEIRDITQTALESLVIQLNNANKNRYGYVGKPFSVCQSVNVCLFVWVLAVFP